MKVPGKSPKVGGEKKGVLSPDPSTPNQNYVHEGCNGRGAIFQGGYQTLALEFPMAPATPTNPPNATSIVELGSKILFVVVPATCAWVIKLEVMNAQQDLEIQQIQAQIQESKLQEKDITDIKIQIGMLQVKQDALSAKIDKLYSVLIEGGGPR